ncbi:hypothetical protein JTE90_011210 [Oedothorax gibbosus]|uniref:ATM interactor n=1 Tax=Oedothorax gibbosus TaxID=931172 RepID=A0AAV6VYI8_9ARAC|nr:hypothetical protein JTE90_011210 [Oedothorax gibbosus]
MSVKNKPKKIKAPIHCPVLGCLYFSGSERHFTEKKFLNQHIAKVHAEKKFSCSKCSKSFGLDWWRKHHEKTCGMEWKCHCGAKYSSRESFLTHARRTQHKLPESVEKVKQAKVPTEVNPPSVILLIQPIIQNCTCIQPTQNPVVNPQPILPKPPCFFSNASTQSSGNKLCSPIYTSTIKDAPNESFAFNISSNSCTNTVSASSTVTSVDAATSVVEKISQKTISTQTIDLECPGKTRESRASQCSRRKSKVMAVGIESTHTQTAESSVVKIKKRRYRRKSVAITTEASMLIGQDTDVGPSLWPNFKDLILPNPGSCSNRGYKSTTSTQTSNTKVLCDSQTLTDDELFKFVWDEAVKGKDTTECFNSLVGMLPDMTSDDPMATLQGDIDQNHMLSMFPHDNSISNVSLDHPKNSTSIGEVSTAASEDKETCTLFSAFEEDGSKADHLGKVSNTQTQTISPDVLDYTLLENMDYCSKSEVPSKVSDIHTQTIASSVLDYNLLANMETQTTDDFSLYDLEFSDTETQTPWEDFPNIDDSPLPSDQLSIEIQTDFSSLTPTIGEDSYNFMNGLNMQSMMGECSTKEVIGVNSETQTQDKFTFPQFTNSESQTIDLSHFMFTS